MKKKVIVFLDKKLDDEQRDIVMLALEDTFPSKKYEVDMYYYNESRFNMDLNTIWKNERTPILVGYRMGAIYLEDIKNYSKKYLLSPTYNENLGLSLFYDTDEYDRKNTFVLFSSSERELEIAEKFEDFYPNTYANANLKCDMDAVTAIFELQNFLKYLKKKD